MYACTAILSLFTLFVSAAPRQWAIREVQVQRFEREDFYRLAQYFTKKPIPFRHGLCRDDESRSQGIYAICFLNNSVRRLPKSAQIRLEFLLSGDERMRQIDGNFQKPRRNSRELWIGLTDKCWENLMADDILAWRITIYDNEDTLCTRSSFLFRAKTQPVADAISSDASGK
ncbi:MAG: hypothetical protein LBC42_02795 [Puniceicoccales bacterium]|jgi:hypothetical protein|nr:hypothetical protein [Puniceicoccales bacterium]